MRSKDRETNPERLSGCDAHASGEVGVAVLLVKDDARSDQGGGSVAVEFLGDNRVPHLDQPQGHGVSELTASVADLDGGLGDQLQESGEERHDSQSGSKMPPGQLAEAS